MKVISFITILATCLLTTSFKGCKDIQSTQPNHSQETNIVVQTSSSAVCIGVENGWAGPCPGAKIDAQRMASLLKTQVNEVTVLLDKEATVANVKAAFSEAVKSDFTVVFYSGHGGQDITGDASEEDGKDEFMCLYDTAFYDNDIWKLLQKAKRAVLICDCCHSKTMFRTSNLAKAVAYKATKPKLLQASRDFSVQLLCWSGCPDDTYSYGSSAGGEFTNAILKYWKEGISYEDLWKKLKADSQLKRAEDIQQTVIGQSFTNKQAFK